MCRAGASGLPWQGHQGRRAQSTECEWGTSSPGVGVGQGKGHGGSLLGRRKTSRADIPPPGTGPRALFPSGAQPSLWLCSKTLPQAQGATCSNTTQSLVSQRPWKTPTGVVSFGPTLHSAQIGAERPPAVFPPAHYGDRWAQVGESTLEASAGSSRVQGPSPSAT